MSTCLSAIPCEGTIVCESEVQEVDNQSMPEEIACIRGAARPRRAQFGTGRLCARRALSLLGIPSTPLTVRPAGSVRWPPGVVGSITHTSSDCAVVIKSSPPWRLVGLDAEQLQPLEFGVAELITTETERRWLASFPHGARDDRPILLFSAKEAYSKAQCPITGRFLEFREVEIDTDLGTSSFRAVARVDVPAELASMCGCFAILDGKAFCDIEVH